MSNITIRTKQPQLVDPARNLSRVVYLEITDKWHRYEDDVLQFHILYYYLDNGKKVKVKYKAKEKILTRDEVLLLSSNITPSGDDYLERERSYALGGALAIVEADSADNWGLTANDWEVAN